MKMAVTSPSVSADSPAGGRLIRKGSLWHRRQNSSVVLTSRFATASGSTRGSMGSKPSVLKLLPKNPPGSLRKKMQKQKKPIPKRKRPVLRKRESYWFNTTMTIALNLKG